MSDSVWPHRWQPPGSPVPGILQARTLEWVAISFSNAWKWKVKIESEVAQSCPTLSDPMDCSPPGSSIHGIFQAKVPESGAIAFSAPFSQVLLLLRHSDGDPPRSNKHLWNKWYEVSRADEKWSQNVCVSFTWSGLKWKISGLRHCKV